MVTPIIIIILILIIIMNSSNRTEKVKVSVSFYGMFVLRNREEQGFVLRA